MVLLTESCLPPTLVTRGRGVARGWGQPLPPVLTSVRYWSSPSGYCRVSSGLIQEIVIAIIWSAKKKKKYLPQPVKLWSVWTALCDRFQLKTTFMFMLDLCYNIFHFQVWQISDNIDLPDGINDRRNVCGLGLDPIQVSITGLLWHTQCMLPKYMVHSTEFEELRWQGAWFWELKNFLPGSLCLSLGRSQQRCVLVGALNAARVHNYRLSPLLLLEWTASLF